MSNFDLAKVVNVHPGGNAIDVIMYSDGAQLSNIQVMSGQAANNSGTTGLCQPGPGVNTKDWSLDDSGDGDQIAVIGLLAGMPVCFGFLFPQVSQMLFTDRNRAIRRHPSDWYESIDDAGNYEMYHPSGTYLRIGATPAHEDLTGKDFDGQWKITKNTGAAPYVHMTVANAGTEVAHVEVDPSGNVTLDHQGDLSSTTHGAATVTIDKDLTANVTGKATATVGGDLTANVTGNMTATVTGDLDATAAAINLTGPTTINGSLAVNGPTTLNGGVTQGAGSNGGTFAIQGPVNVTTDVNVSGDVVIQNKSTINHNHTDVQGGIVGPMQN